MLQWMRTLYILMSGLIIFYTVFYLYATVYKRSRLQADVSAADRIILEYLDNQRQMLGLLKPECNKGVKVDYPLPELGDLHTSLLGSTQPKLFFLETSGSNVLNLRQSCAAESGARVSGRQTFVVLVASTLDICQEQMSRLVGMANPPLFLHLNETEFIANTLIEPIWTNGKIYDSTSKTIHRSDIFRMLIVHKYGGWYSDLDTVTVSRTAYIKWNVACANGDGQFIGNANFGQEAGSLYLGTMLQKSVKKYNPKVWNCLGPPFWTDTLRELDGNKTEFVGKHPGAQIWVMSPHAFFPIPGSHRRVLFEYHDEAFWEKTFERAVIIHFFNQLTGRTVSEKAESGNKTAYDWAGPKFCPSTFTIHNHLNIQPQKTEITKT